MTSAADQYAGLYVMDNGYKWIKFHVWIKSRDNVDPNWN